MFSTLKSPQWLAPECPSCPWLSLEGLAVLLRSREATFFTTRVSSLAVSSIDVVSRQYWHRFLVVASYNTRLVHFFNLGLQRNVEIMKDDPRTFAKAVTPYFSKFWPQICLIFCHS